MSLRSKKFFFIVGMPRASTTWLAHILGYASPKVFSFGETTLFGRSREVLSACDANSVLNLINNVLLFQQVSPDVLPRDYLKINALPIPDTSLNAFTIYKNVIEAIEQKTSRPVVVEKTPHHLRYIPEIKAALPESSFIILIRNPFTWLKSYKAQAWRKMPEVRKAFDKQYNVFVALMIYNSNLRYAQKAVSDYPESTLLLPFEEVISDSEKAVEKVQEFWGLGELDGNSSNWDGPARESPNSSQGQNSSFSEGVVMPAKYDLKNWELLAVQIAHRLFFRRYDVYSYSLVTGSSFYLDGVWRTVTAFAILLFKLLLLPLSIAKIFFFKLSSKGWPGFFGLLGYIRRLL